MLRSEVCVCVYKFSVGHVRGSQMVSEHRASESEDGCVHESEGISGERQPVSTKNCVLVCASLTLVGSGLRVSPAAWFCRFTCKT